MPNYNFNNYKIFKTLYLNISLKYIIKLIFYIDYKVFTTFYLIIIIFFIL